MKKYRIGFEWFVSMKGWDDIEIEAENEQEAKAKFEQLDLDLKYNHQSSIKQKIVDLNWTQDLGEVKA